MQLALRRRVRMPLPICHCRCGPTHGCGARTKIVERAWLHVARARRRRCRGPGGETTTPGVLSGPTPLRCGHLWRDTQPLRAVLRRDIGIAAEAHGLTTAVHARGQLRPADSRATQSKVTQDTRFVTTFEILWRVEAL